MDKKALLGNDVFMSSSASVSKHDILSSRLPFRPSRTALALILATIFLAVILAFSILQHISRAQDLMERFLLEKGETIITAIEAGMRTSMMHFMGGGDPLQTLITESSRENDIVFIRIMNSRGEVVNQTKDAPRMEFSAKDVERIMVSNVPVTRVEKQKGIFILAKRFRLHDNPSDMPMMMGRRMPMMGEYGQNLSDGIISIGLYTKEFDLARSQDIQHAFFMGAILFLVGSAGLYFLFLYQGMRVAETTLANMKLYTNNVVESIPVGIVTLDTEERIVSYNRKMEEIVGRSLDKCKGEKLTAALPGCPLDSLDVRTAAFEQSAECLASDGRNISIKIGASSLVNNDGEVIGTVLIVRDMTAIKEMEQQLERSRRMAALGKMAAGIAHEIRNPLGTLRGFAHYFGNQAGASKESKSYADLMVSEVDRLNRNISGLLQFARPREPQFVAIDLDQLITKTVALMEGDFAENELNFHWRCNAGIKFEGDPDLLLQVLMNLLKNSIHASSSGGEVSLTGSEDEHFIRITVSDTGSGMSEQEQEKMFDPFFTTKKTGTGLGLAVSHQIVEQHRGKFEVETVPGQGTVITILLPKNKRTS
jgi:two-component system, NtrC family, sensor histidine kinase HydH